MLLLLDNFDSFTYNLFDYLCQLNIECVIRRNDVEIDEIKRINVSGLVVSPGTGIPTQSGNLMQVLDFYHDKIPILGICLGHQAIGEYFGARLIKASKPMHGKLSLLDLTDDCIFDNLPNQIKVVRYNSLILELGKHSNLRPIAFSQQKEIMAIKHNQLPIWGLQYHPEAALSEYGLATLRNWVIWNNVKA